MACGWEAARDAATGQPACHPCGRESPSSREAAAGAHASGHYALPARACRARPPPLPLCCTEGSPPRSKATFWMPAALASSASFLPTTVAAACQPEAHRAGRGPPGSSEARSGWRPWPTAKPSAIKVLLVCAGAAHNQHHQAGATGLQLPANPPPQRARCRLRPFESPAASFRVTGCVLSSPQSPAHHGRAVALHCRLHVRGEGGGRRQRDAASVVDDLGA